MSSVVVFSIIFITMIAMFNDLMDSDGKEN